MQIIATIDGPLAGHPFNGGHFGLVGGDNQLATAAERHAMAFEVGIKHYAAGHAQAGFQAAFGIIQSGMDHFGIARRGFRPDAFGLFDHHHRTSRECDGACHRQAHHARTNHHRINIGHPCSPCTLHRRWIISKAAHGRNQPRAGIHLPVCLNLQWR